MAGFFGPDFIEQVRAANDIIEVIGGYFPLKRAGASFVALCPFHREKSPSFHVSASRQAFHCFGCHKGGDVFRFVQDYESVTFIEAVQRLAQRASIPLQYADGSGPDRSQHLKETLRQIHEQISRRWQGALATEAQGQIARDYLAKRGVTEESIKQFRIGYAPEAWDDTVNWCKSHGFELELAQQAGLIVKKEGTDRFYDRFRGRLMFPIADEQGRIIAFSGRILQGDEKTAKYVNSPETPIFSKSKVFYGLDKTKRAILDAGVAIICEGQLDLIACFQGGVQNIVAPQGTAFTPEHARILKRYVEEVVLCFDSDNAGQNAAVRVLDGLLGVGMAIRVAVVPAPHDPDSYIKEFGGPAFAQLIKNASGFFDFYLDRLTKQNDIQSDRGRMAVLREMGTAVNKTANSVMVDKYVQRTAVTLGVSAESVRQEFKKLRPTPEREREAPENILAEEEQMAGEVQPVPMAKPSSQEIWLLKLVMGNDDILPTAATHLDLEWIRHGLVRHILQLRLTPTEDGFYPSVATLIGTLPDDESRRLVSEHAMEGRTIPKAEKTLMDLLVTLRNQTLDRELEQLKLHLADASIGEEERFAIPLRMNEIRALKKQPLQAMGGEGGS
jgi:DNA primase